MAANAVNGYLSDFSGNRFDRKMVANGLPEDMEVPLRDDGMLLWNAMRKWSADYVQQAYSSDSAVQMDAALQAWAVELTGTDAGTIRGLCTDGGGNPTDNIQTRDCLEQLLSQIVWVATAGHAATNYPQGQFTSYTILSPVAGYSTGPDFASREDKLSGQAWMEMLPRTQGAVLQRDAGYNLGTVYYNTVGHYLGQYAGTWEGWLDSKYAASSKAFEDALVAIGQTVTQRNTPCGGVAGCKKTRRNSFLAYEVLHPTNIPNSINI